LSMAVTYEGRFTRNAPLKAAVCVFPSSLSSFRFPLCLAPPSSFFRVLRIERRLPFLFNVQSPLHLRGKARNLHENPIFSPFFFFFLILPSPLKRRILFFRLLKSTPALERKSSPLSPLTVFLFIKLLGDLVLCPPFLYDQDPMRISSSHPLTL